MNAMADPRYIHNPEVAWRILPAASPEAGAGEEEAVLLSIETTTYYSLDPVGTHIWKEFARPTTRGEALARVVEAFEVDEPTAAKDLDELLSDLVSEKLLVDAAA